MAERKVREEKKREAKLLEGLYLPQFSKKSQSCPKEDDLSLPILNVPCLAWISSQSPDTYDEGGKAYKEINAPIIIFWMETLPPKYVKRRLYYSFLDENPEQGKINMYADLAKGIERLNTDFKHVGFNINATNTFRYVYPVPKFIKPRTRFAGKNLHGDYAKCCRIPSYFADYDALQKQGLVRSDEDIPLNALVNSKNTMDEQALYRNIVINYANNIPKNNSTAALAPIENRNLYAIANLLGWNVDVFLQYVAENTLLNFKEANRGEEDFKNVADEDLKSVSDLIRSIGYKFASDALKRQYDAELVYPDDFIGGAGNQPFKIGAEVTGIQYFTNDYSYLNDALVFGLRIPKFIPE